MTGSSPLAPRGLWGVVVPTTNTATASEIWAVRPAGVNFHLAGIYEPPDFYSLDSDARIAHYRSTATRDAVDRALLADPDLVVMWMSSATMYGGMAAVERFASEFAGWCCGTPSVMAAEAAIAAAQALNASQISVITPYWEETEPHIREYFGAHGVTVHDIVSLDVGRSADIVRHPRKRIVDALRSLAVGGRSEVIVQLGAGLALGGIAPTAHLWLGQPVLAFNPTVLWWLLRRAGITDRYAGHGILLEEC